MKKIICLFLFNLVLMSSLVYAGPEASKSLGTYHTSVMGTYDRMRLIPRPTISPTNACNIGTFYVNSLDSTLIYFCNGSDANGEWGPLENSDVWTSDGTNIYLADTLTPIDKKVGLGTTAPSFKLTLENDGVANDGGIIAIGDFSHSAIPPDPDVATLTTSGSGIRFFWYPHSAAIRAGQVSGTQWNDSNVGKFSAAFGNNPLASEYHTAISGGADNQAIESYTSIIGGQGNIVSGERGAIGGGLNNLVENDRGAIGGGNSNSISGTDGEQFIGGGENNSVSAGWRANIVGGLNNTSNGPISHIVGGENNTSSGGYTIIAGGKNNQTSSYATTLMGGEDNTIDGASTALFSTISGGNDNLIRLTFSTISGGHLNSALNIHATVLGGQQNTSSVEGATILGGENNQGTVIQSFVGGGQNNISGGQQSTILGGTNNQTSGDFSFIGGGDSNTVSGDYSVIPGGINNTVSGNYSFASGYNVNVSGNNTFAWGVDTVTPIDVTESSAFIIATGNVGINNLNPQSKLHVDGNIQIDNGNLILADASGGVFVGAPVNVGAGNILGKDISEVFETSETVEIGDVLVVDVNSIDKFTKSQTAYDKKVVGIVSAAPAMIFEGSDLHIKPKPFKFTKGTKPPVALSGRVLCKVSLENGAIEPGDLLTTSSTPGHAMKAERNPEKSFGKILGKALQSFDGGDNNVATGMIEVFVTLQ